MPVTWAVPASAIRVSLRLCPLSDREKKLITTASTTTIASSSLSSSVAALSSSSAPDHNDVASNPPFTINALNSQLHFTAANKPFSFQTVPQNCVCVLAYQLEPPKVSNFMKVLGVDPTSSSAPLVPLVPLAGQSSRSIAVMNAVQSSVLSTLNQMALSSSATSSSVSTLPSSSLLSSQAQSERALAAQHAQQDTLAASLNKLPPIRPLSPSSLVPKLRLAALTSPSTSSSALSASVSSSSSPSTPAPLISSPTPPSSLPRSFSFYGHDLSMTEHHIDYESVDFHNAMKHAIHNLEIVRAQRFAISITLSFTISFARFVCV